MKDLPPPSLPRRPPGRPRKNDPTAPSNQAAPAPAGAPTPPTVGAPAPGAESTTRELPADPVERAKALESVKGEVEFILTIADVAASRLPPHRALSADERTALSGPLAAVVWKYNADIPPEFQLIAAVAIVALGRYAEIKAIDVTPVIPSSRSPLGGTKAPSSSEAPPAP